MIGITTKTAAVYVPDLARKTAIKLADKFLTEIPKTVNEFEIAVKFPGSNLVLRKRTTGETVPVTDVLAKIRYSATTVLNPFRLVRYKDKSNDNNIVDAAYTDVTVGDHLARLLIVNKENEGIKVMLDRGKWPV
ncbi:MAG: hypothetical protein HQK96_17265 [Nitrospirae bacterium]|nr:hypothetical protein [Nitrospirota bacterium]